MYFTLEKSLYRESEEVIVGITSLEVGNVAVSFYHALRKGRCDLVRSLMLNDQNFTPARCCAKTVEEMKETVSQISRKNRIFSARQLMVERIVQLCGEAQDPLENICCQELKEIFLIESQKCLTYRSRNLLIANLLRYM